MSLQTQRDVLDHRHRREQPCVLERPAEAQNGPAVRRLVRHVAAQEENPAGCRSHEAADRIEDRGLAGPVGTDETENLALMQLEGCPVNRLHTAEAHHHVAEREQLRPRDDLRRLLGLVGGRGASGRSPLSAVRCARDRLALGRTLEKHRPEDVVALEQFGGRTFEADLALLHEDRTLGQRQCHIDRLLDQGDGRPLSVNLADDAGELADDRGCQAEGQLVDHQQLGLGDERHGQAEHLLLATGQVAGELVTA